MNFAIGNVIDRCLHFFAEKLMVIHFFLEITIGNLEDRVKDEL